MQSSRMTRRFSAFPTLTAIAGVVLVFHGAAFAQQENQGAASPNPPSPTSSEPAPPAENTQAPAAASQPATPTPVPPDYGPPPGYQRPSYGPPQGYAPGYYGHSPGYYPRPRYYTPPPANYSSVTSYRTVVFGFGLGIGGVAIFPHGDGATTSSENSSRAGMGYNLHLGFGVSPRWSLVFSGDGSWAYFDGYDVSQTAWTIGPQVFLNRILYVRGGVGVATYSQTYDDGVYVLEDSTDSGMAMTAAVGFEFMQGYHTAMALEFAATMGSYPNKDRVGTMGINFILNLF